MSPPISVGYLYLRPLEFRNTEFTQQCWTIRW